MKKLVSFLILIVLIILSLCSCGEVNTSNSNSAVTVNAAKETNNNSNISLKEDVNNNPSISLNTDVVGVWYGTYTNFNSYEDAKNEYNDLAADDYLNLFCFIFMNNGYCIADDDIEAAGYINPQKPTIEQVNCWRFDLRYDYSEYSDFDEAFLDGFIQKYDNRDGKVTITYSDGYSETIEVFSEIQNQDLRDYLIYDDSYYFRASGFCSPYYSNQFDYYALLGNWIAETSNGDKTMASFRDDLRCVFNDYLYWSMIGSELTLSGWSDHHYRICQISIDTILIYPDKKTEFGQKCVLFRQ